MTIPDQIKPFPILNVKPNDKEPAEANGVNSARVDMVIKPGNNYGVAGGAGLLFVDCDNHSETKPGVANFQKLMDKHGCPDTFTVETPGNGCHIYFRLPPGKSYPSKNDVLGPGVDIKCEGGYVVGPGSVRGGKAYEVATAHSVAYAPKWLVDMLDVKLRPKEKVVVDPPSPEVLARRKACAEKLLGPVQWETSTTGNCKCPGESKHGNSTGDTHCQVHIDGAPTIHCFHASCDAEVEEANLALRRACSEPTADVLAAYYYDAGAKSFWASDSNIGWLMVGVDGMKRELAVRGVSPDRGRGELISAADKALVRITKTRAVDGAFPGFYRKEEVIIHHQYRLLNVSRVRCLTADDAPNPNGEGCPWIKEYLNRLVGVDHPDPREATHGIPQRGVLLAWVAHFYRAALAGHPNRGLAMFLAGPPGSGKTFFTNAILKPVFGAVGEATKFLCGDDQFNAGIFGCPIWNVDDAISTSEPGAHARFSQAVKAVVANDEFTMRAMRREGVRMPWNGRLVTTMNSDPDSIRMLPHGEGSMKDKYILIKTFPTFEEFPTDEQLAKELPFFCSWLRDMPDDTTNGMVGGRFGVLSFHHPDLVAMAKEESATFNVYELIQTWAFVWFKDNKCEKWEGNPTALQSELSTYDGTKEIAKSLRLSPASLGRALAKMLAIESPGIAKNPGRRHGRVYFITREILG